MNPWSVFILDDGGTWEQPTIDAPEDATSELVEAAALKAHGRHAIIATHAAPDPDCPPKCCGTWPDSIWQAARAARKVS